MSCRSQHSRGQVASRGWELRGIPVRAANEWREMSCRCTQHRPTTRMDQAYERRNQGFIAIAA
jgi:hypothetical protein